MSKPATEDVYVEARALLADDQAVGAQIFTDPILAPHAAQAIRELFRVLAGAQDPFVLTENFLIVPPQTGVVDPADFGITNISEVEFLEWLQIGTPATVVIPISNVVISGGPAFPVATVTTSAPHNMTIGNVNVAVYGVVGFDTFNSPNGYWSAVATDATHIQLNGCSSTGTYVSGGSILQVMGATATSAGQFLLMSPRDRIEYVAAVPGSPDMTDESYAWEGGLFRFYPSTNTRLIRVTYRTSASFLATTPNTTVIPIDDSLDYLATRTAGLAAGTRLAGNRARELNLEALGPTLQADGSGGILGQLLRKDIRNLQRNQYRYNSFRARRNRPDLLLF